MKLEEMTLDVEQHVEVKADIGDVFKGVRTGLAKAVPPERRVDADDSGAVARRTMVSRSW